VSIDLQFEVSQPGWYFIVATSKESVRFAFAEGTYNIILVGTTYRTLKP
jgi:hypothetical protein